MGSIKHKMQPSSSLPPNPTALFGFYANLAIHWSDGAIVILNLFKLRSNYEEILREWIFRQG